MVGIRQAVSGKKEGKKMTEGQNIDRAKKRLSAAEEVVQNFVSTSTQGRGYWPIGSLSYTVLIVCVYFDLMLNELGNNEDND